jgi:hypothetical protein
MTNFFTGGRVEYLDDIAIARFDPVTIDISTLTKQILTFELHTYALAVNTVNERAPTTQVAMGSTTLQ